MEFKGLFRSSSQTKKIGELYHVADKKMIGFNIDLFRGFRTRQSLFFLSASST